MSLQVQENINLQPYNTFGISVIAKYWSEQNTIDGIKALLSDSKYKSEEKLILGGGSNILLTRDFDGLVIKNNLKGITVVSEDENYFYVKVGAGENWHQLVLHAIDNNWAGLENLSLIPGNVGAGPMQNIGAYGVELKDVFYELEAIHIHDLTTHKFSATDCKFGYRESVFKREFKNQFMITAVTFKLCKTPNYTTSYGAIEAELQRMNISTLTIKAISDAVINIRSSKLPDPKKIGNAGSFFKNPEVSAAKKTELLNIYSNLVNYNLPNGNFKLAAGWLIEQCGWKGKTIGNVGVHKDQALVLVNYGKGSGREVYDLSTEIIASVNQKFGVLLEREVNIL